MWVSLANPKSVNFRIPRSSEKVEWIGLLIDKIDEIDKSDEFDNIDETDELDKIDEIVRMSKLGELFKQNRRLFRQKLDK